MWFFVAFAVSSRGWLGAAEPVDYLRQVKPVLKERCQACHGALKQKAGLRLDTGEAIRQGGDSGPAAVPGELDESPMLERVMETDPKLRMPPEGSPLTAEQVATLRAWIEQGATSPSNEAPEADPRRHWAFLPPARPIPPAGAGKDWARNPIDRFVAREHERRGLTPLPPANPQALLRRVYLDLVGLPPSRAELLEFLQDPSDVAYARVVDRLLGSPQYGERWARHWMDVWRYSDWYGRRSVPDVTNSYAQIWRWRDWIVRSLNADKGYDRMVQEMLAGDELAPGDPATVVATGFVVRNWYRWNYNSWMKDNVEHTAKAFLGLTVNCAHCHDHKYDPITQEDYFRLRACFEPLELRHERVPGEPDPGPFPKYDYGKSYPPITSGMVRVFDETLDAKTFLYTRGESRNVVAGRPPIPPGAPAFLGGADLRVEPVSLPVEAYYPGFLPSAQREAIAREEAAVSTARQAWEKSRGPFLASAKAAISTFGRRVAAGLHPGGPKIDASKAFDELEVAWINLRADEAQLAAARAKLVAVQTRVAADDARYGRAPGDPQARAREASRAERLSAAAQASAALALADKARLQASRKARTDPKARDEVAKAEAQVTEARKALDAARSALAKESTEYAPFGPVFPAKSTGRRLALARWITDRKNPLAARVAVNHLWNWHFGRPIAATTHDLGRNGKAPTHPELLDWLAVELMEPTTSGVPPWSLKHLHRLIVTSATYRLASGGGDSTSQAARAADPQDLAYWRFPPARMEAEVVRDSLLHVAGELDPAVGGADIDFAQGLTSRRRSLYFTHHGEARMPFLELFDAADAVECYRRTTSVVPQQALALTNNEWLLSLSKSLAERLWAEVCGSATDGADPAVERAFITAAFEQVLARSPSPPERDLSADFLRRQSRIVESAKDVASGPTRARRDFIHALFSHNEFVTIR